MKTIYLHIGMHKTGSTAIQSAFKGYDNGRILYAPLGFENHSIPFYTVFSGRHRGYHIWRRAGLGPEEIDKKRAELDGVIRSFFRRELDQDVVVSGEDISILPPHAVAELAQLFGATGAKTSVVTYVRDPYSFISSNLQESIKAGLDVSRPAAPEYQSRIEKFILNFGRENVVVRNFARQGLKDGDVVRDFAELIHVENPPSPSSENLSLSTEATRVVYLLNQFVSAAVETREIGKARKKLIQHVRKLFPGKFSIPENLMAGLVDDADLEWLFEVSAIDFRRQDQTERPAFDPVALHRFLSEPEPATLETLRDYLSKECGVPSPPLGKEFLVARYFMSFLESGFSSWWRFDPDRYLKLNPDVRRAGVNPFEHFLRFGSREGRRTE